MRVIDLKDLSEEGRLGKYLFYHQGDPGIWGET